MQALDAKIHKWSSGKKGNIRSLLSTLQYVRLQSESHKCSKLGFSHAALRFCLVLILCCITVLLVSSKLMHQKN